MKAQKARWTDHCTGDERMELKKLRVEMRESSRKSRPSVRGVDKVMKDIKRLGIEEWRGKH